MKKKIIMEFRCLKCKKLQPKDESMSNNNWNVYDAKAKCECGGKYRIFINGEPI